ncbi:MAG: hypothetical protein RR197_05060 [Oscillospiraceae bacterium]
MTTWFIYKGVDSREMGVIARSYPGPARASERMKAIPIPARFEVLHKREGDYPVYDPIDMGMEIAVERGGDPGKALNWLRGDGDMVFGDAPNFTRHVWLTDDLELKPFGKRRAIWTGTLNMEGAPYRMERFPAVLSPARTDYLKNPGDYEAYPLITIGGSGTCDITIGGKTISPTGISGTVTLDCAAKIAVTDGQSSSGIVSGDWPVIEPGRQEIIWSGTATSVIIAPRWRYV